jgi:hypothetical protein
MISVHLGRSPLATKKFRVAFEDGTHTDFGAKGYSDFTIHNDPERKKRYIIRHQKRENWTNIKTAGFWSRWLLWEKPSLMSAKKFMSRRFGIKFS